MKLTIIIFSMFALLSCGKKHYNTQVIENSYDNSSNEKRLEYLEARLLLQTTKNEFYEAKLTEIESELNILDELTGEAIQSINDNYEQLNQNIESIENTLLNYESIKMIKVCSSNEYLLKLNNDYYAVYMVSNNYGTYIGKLELNINYRTTDNVKADFKLTNSGIQCL